MTIDEPLREAPIHTLMPDDPNVRDYLVKLLTLEPSQADRLEDVWNAYQKLLAILLEKKDTKYPPEESGRSMNISPLLF